MQHLSLAWRALAEKNFVKSANAVAKLDLAKEILLCSSLNIVNHYSHLLILKKTVLYK